MKLDSFSKIISNNCFEIYKEIGETPLAALEKFRATHSEFKNLPMTYAGRLDPMAEGVLIILVGEECKNKEKYLGLDKEYEVEIVFGISTDTYDALGLVANDPKFTNTLVTEIDLAKYIGKFSQEYPPYSSKTVEGVALHTLARQGELPEMMPEKEVEIYSIEMLEQRKLGNVELLDLIINKISLVKGDFRQEKIVQGWRERLGQGIQNSDQKSLVREDFIVQKLRVKCSSGTYMRSLAMKIGRDIGNGAFALSIKRTRVFTR